MGEERAALHLPYSRCQPPPVGMSIEHQVVTVYHHAIGTVGSKGVSVWNRTVMHKFTFVMGEGWGIPPPIVVPRLPMGCIRHGKERL